MPEVVLVHRPTVDVNVVATLTQHFLGRSPSACIDASPRDFTDDAKAVIRLVSCETDQRDAVKALRNSQAVQPHFSYTFLVRTSPGGFDEIVLLNTGLALTLVGHNFDNPLFFMSGHLGQWREAVVAGCTPATSTEVRTVFDKINLWFEKLGLAEIWSRFRRASASDGTFYLEGPRG